MTTSTLKLPALNCRIFGKPGDWRRAHYTSDGDFLAALDSVAKASPLKRLFWLRPAFTKRVALEGDFIPTCHTPSGTAVFANRPQPADAVVLDVRHTAVMLANADCPCVVITDNDSPRWAVVHAGCKCIYPAKSSLLRQTIDQHFAGRQIHVFAGFGIGACCYGVEGCIAEGTIPQASTTARKGPRRGQRSLDLLDLITAQLPEKRVLSLQLHQMCTACNGRVSDHDMGGSYWSHAWDSALLEEASVGERDDGSDRPGEELVGRNACLFWVQ